MAEEQESCLPPPLVRGVVNLLPTRHLGMPSLEIERQAGVRRPVSLCIFTSMELSSDDSIDVSMIFSGIGGLQKIVYSGIEVPIFYVGVDPWRVIHETWRLLPPKSMR